MKWYYQTVPHDIHDWDLPQVSPVFSTTIKGKTRNVIAASGKDGLLKLIDRDTHEQLYSVPFVTRENVDVPLPMRFASVPALCGGAEWSSPPYDPATNTLFEPANDCPPHTLFDRRSCAPRFPATNTLFEPANDWCAVIRALSSKKIRQSASSFRRRFLSRWPPALRSMGQSTRPPHRLRRFHRKRALALRRFEAHARRRHRHIRRPTFHR